MIHPCMMQGIQGVLVVCCLCASPPATTWSHVEEGFQRWGFRSGRRLAPCLRGGGRGKFSAGWRCTSWKATRHRYQAGYGEVVTPSLHPEVPDTRFVSPGRGLDIRQSMGWTKVCSTARSGIWVLKGNARTCMLPENLEHLRMGWISRGSYETAWVTPGHDCLCPYQYGHGAAVSPQTNDAIWNGVIGLWCRVAPLLSPWCARRMCQRE